MLSELKKKYVYHYTSVETLLAILYAYKHRKEKTKEYLTFRASNIFAVNDPTEMEAGFYALKRFLPLFEDLKKIPLGNRISEVYHHKEYEEKCKEDFLKKENTIDIGTIPYIVSFSSRKDYLPMWSLYGKNGLGVCMKFNLYEIVSNPPPHCQSGFVTYGKSLGKAAKEIISYFYPNNILTINDKIFELATLNLSTAPFQKYRDYRYEEEFRIVHLCHYGQNDKNRSLNESFAIPKSSVKSYIEIPISTKALSDIIVGPNANFDVIKPIIDQELHNCGINVKSHKSKVPFRL